MSFWKKSHGLTIPDRWFLKDCKTKHATSTREQPGRSHDDTKSLSNPGSVSSSQHGGCVSHGLTCTGTAGQAEQASKCNGSATDLVQTKIRSMATTRAFISQGELWLQRKEGQELLWLSVSCILPTPGPRWQRQLQLHVGNMCCTVAGGTYMQERLWPPPFLTTLGLYRGFWHMQLQTMHRLLDQLSSSLQWSEPCSVGMLLHRGSADLPLGTLIPLEKLFSRNLNIKLLGFSLTFWGLLSQPIIYLVQSSTMSQKAVMFCSAILSCF